MAIILSGETEKKKLPRVITSFNEAYYKRCGKDFVDSWQQYWPASIGLTVFYEGNSEAFDMNTHGISWRPIEEVEHLPEFMGMLQFPIMHGIVGNAYDIRWDARMGRKAFMEMYAMKTYGGKVFWIDADTVTTKHVPENFLDGCLPDDAFCCYLGRDGWYYTESGFIGFNANHPISSRFYKNYLNVFLSGAIFTRPEGWHDCIAFDCIRHVLGDGPEFIDLAAHLPRGTMHPQVNAVCGEYMTHLKGPRKDTKKLKEGDVVGSK